MVDRYRAAFSFAAKHLAVSALVALACSVLVFFFWYPFPFSVIASGRELFMLVVIVDVVIGPALSAVVYDPAKRRTELWRDLSIIFVLQAVALGYGLYSVSQARPVWIAFEGDRFRVVAVPDLEVGGIHEAPPSLQSLSWTGPKLVGVHLLTSADPGYLKSLELAIAGNHPAFRPSRWVPFELQRTQVIASLKPIEQLRVDRPDRYHTVEAEIRKRALSEARIGWLHLASQRTDEWIALVSRETGEPVAYLNLDGP